MTIERVDRLISANKAGFGIVITDVNGRIQHVNPEVTAMTGYTREEAVGQSPRIFKSGRQTPALYEELWNTIRSGRVWRGDVINRRKDGTFYQEDLQIAPVHDSKREVVSYIAIKREVTKPRGAEEGHAFLAAIGENSEDAIVAYTAAGVILTWNRGAELISNYSAGDAIGKHVSMLVPPDRLAELSIFTERILQGSAATQPDGMCVGKDGRRIHVSITGYPIWNDTGKVVAISAILRDTSENKEAEQARALLASIVESSNDAIHSVKLDGTVLSWNRSAEVLFGYSRQEIIGRNAAVFAPTGGDDEIRRCIETIRKAYTVSPFETVLQKKDGRRIDVLLSISPIRNPAGEVTGASVISRDIGTRLLAERKVRESDERFREVFEHAPFAMCVTGLDGRFIQVNGAVCRMLGYSEQELLDKTWAELTHPEDLRPSLRLMDVLCKDPDGCLEAEKRYIHRSGRVVWARIKISMVRDVCGNPSYCVAHLEDITERKRTEEALRESEDRFRIMADSCPTVMWVTNAQGGIQFINRAFREFVGANYEQVAGDKWQLALHPEDGPEYIAVFQRAVREHTPFRAEARVRRADGEWRWVASYAEARLSPGGEYLGHVGLSPDINERKQAEEALQSSEERFRQLAENIREVFWMMPPAANEILYVSPAYEQVWGRTCDSLYQSPMSRLDAIHLDDLERAHLLFAKQIQGEPVESEYRIRTPDGRQKWIRDRAFPIRDQAGQLLRVVGLAEEATEQKRYEAELIHAREAADARSRILEKINRREPLGDVLKAVSILLKQQVADADCCIHMSVGCDYLELVPESCSSSDLSLRLSRVPLDARGEICARAAIGARRIVDVQPRPAYSWPVFDANRLVLGTISVFPHSTAVPDTLGEILDLTTQLVSLAINNRRLYDGLTYRSGHDSLTGLPNRVFLDEHLASSLRSAAGPPVRFAIAYIDLDEFKEVNDVYGHTTGDTFLQIAASRFRSVLRNDDLLARIGGDEFIAVLAGVADRREATRRGQRLLESLKCEFAIGDALRLPCTASIGVALFPEDGSSIDDLKRCADESMYVAKTEGKNQVRACNRIGLPKSQLSSAQLRNAINENRLLVHYQPIFLAEGGLSGFEALVRIEDPSGQLVVPDRFIDLAEKSSLIVALGHSVLRQACRQAAVWARDTRASLRMAVNVSARQFARPDFFKDVLSILSEAHLPPKLLELEITEASILKDLEGAIEQLEQLRRHGVLIAIDDFGTGYSTLSLVHRLPLDAIKIDRSFVQSLTLDGAMHAIKAIIALASGLALQSIAEGVENARQLQTLLSLGCTAFQGYGFARPMCASSIEAQLGGWMATVPNVTHRLETAFDSRTDGVSNPDFAILPSGRWLAETHRDRPEVR